MKDKNIKKMSSKALEQVVKKTFCHSQAIVGCSYLNMVWCPRSCSYGKQITEQTYRWN